MEKILATINAVVGVRGSFVCDEDGELLAIALPSTDRTRVADVSRTIAQTVAGLHTVRRRKVTDLDLQYADGRLLVKNVSGNCLCILCAPRVNVPLLNLTANVAAKKLGSRIKALSETGPVKAAMPLATQKIPEQTAVDTTRLSHFLRPFVR